MAVYHITADALYRMHKLKREMESRKRTRNRWILGITIYIIFWLIMQR